MLPVTLENIKYSSWWLFYQSRTIGQEYVAKDLLIARRDIFGEVLAECFIMKTGLFQDSSIYGII